MLIGVLKEPNHEPRVSILPETAEALIKLKASIIVESDAGEKAFASNADYEKTGASIATRNEVIAKADLILSINTPIEDIQNKIILGIYQPLFNKEAMQAQAAKGNTILSMDAIPRSTRAQAMDVLSSQANIAGYKAVLLAATNYSRYFPMFMTAAGSIPPAKILILGAGVAGLQAIATAKRLGAVVEVFDTRPAVKEEVQSLGAKFIEVEGAADASAAGGYAVEQSDEYKQKQQEKLAASVAKSDIIITTAQIPGRTAPILVTETMLDTMRKGSVIIDLAASTGGNTPFTKNNETVLRNGVSIIGNSNLAATAPSDASKVYGKNVLNFLKLVLDAEGNFNLNLQDDIVKGTCITNGGNIIHEKLV